MRDTSEGVLKSDTQDENGPGRTWSWIWPHGLKANFLGHGSTQINILPMTLTVQWASRIDPIKLNLKTKNLLTPFIDQHMNALDCATRGGAPCSASCVERSDRSEGPVKPVAVQNGDDPTNARPGGTPSGQTHVGLP